MTILITRGAGKTGGPLAQKLHAANHQVLMASRSGNAPEGLKGVRFDWMDPSTHENPFKVDSNIDKVYLVAPDVRGIDVLTPMKPFIDLAIEKGVRRFVFLGATIMGAKGDPLWGKVHEYLDELKGVEYAALRPSAFFENMQNWYGKSIRAHNEITTATQDGKLAFVAADDLADAAFNALLAEKIVEPDLLVVGPEQFTYDQVAEILTEVLGRKIVHKRLSYDEKKDLYKSYQMSDEMATFAANLDKSTAQGEEERIILNSENKKYVGKVHLKDWVEKNKAFWVV